jgi:hypothetical protein
MGNRWPPCFSPAPISIIPNQHHPSELMHAKRGRFALIYSTLFIQQGLVAEEFSW